MAEHSNDAAPNGYDAPWPTMFPRDEFDGARPARDDDAHDDAHDSAHDSAHDEGAGVAHDQCGGDRADEADAGRHRSGRSGTPDDASPSTGSGP